MQSVESLLELLGCNTPEQQKQTIENTELCRGLFVFSAIEKIAENMSKLQWHSIEPLILALENKQEFVICGDQEYDFISQSVYPQFDEGKGGLTIYNRDTTTVVCCSQSQLLDIVNNLLKDVCFSYSEIKQLFNNERYQIIEH